MAEEKASPLLAVIKVKGSVNIGKDAKNTLDMLRLNRVNHCVLVRSTPTFEGMLKKVKQYLTWGRIDAGTLEKLLLKRGRSAGNKRIEASEAKRIAKILEKKPVSEVKSIKPVFRLNPPSKGYKSIKRPFPRGDLGCRGEKINALLKRMI